MGDCDEAGKRNKQERFLLYEKEGGRNRRRKKED